MLRSLELFAGIVGIGLGLEMAGCATPAAFCEIDPFARAVQRKHYPEVRQYADVRTLSADALDRDGITGINLIAGGWPCQPHSTAGKRLASEDERDLWGEFARLIGEIKPRWVVAENVPGLLSSADPAHGRGKGGFFLRVLRDLAALGYDAEWCTFPAAAVGAPHLRNRVFLIAWKLDNAQRLGWTARGADHGSYDRHVSGSASQDAAALAYIDSVRSQGRVQHRGDQALVETRHQPGGSRTEGAGGAVADTLRPGREEQHAPAQPGWAGHPAGGSHAVRHASGEGLPDWAGGTVGQPSPLTEFERPGGREIERDFRGLAHGISNRVDSLGCYGNAVVPRAAQVIGYAITDAEAHWREFGVMPPRIVRPEHIERVRGVA